MEFTDVKDLSMEVEGSNVSLRRTINFLREVLRVSRIEGGRGKLDVFSDRLVKSSSEPTLNDALEHLMRVVDVELDALHSPTVIDAARVGNSSDSTRVLRWLREHAKLATMLAATRDVETVNEALAELKLPEVEESGSVAARRPYDVGVRATCETPLAHGADRKVGNATMFRRIDAVGTNGAHLTLPYYSGNSVRGRVRDLLADHFLSAIGSSRREVGSTLALWFFHALYCGGILEDKSDATKALGKELGNHGAVRADGIRRFRTYIPAISLLGCALGNRVISGRVQFADLRPVCVEWGTGTLPVAELLTWEFLTRREDDEDHAKHHGMIANTEVLRAGTELEGGVDVLYGTSELEKSALGCGLKLLVERRTLGAEGRRGFGRVKLHLENSPDPELYETWLRERREEILEYLEGIGGLIKCTPST